MAIADPGIGTLNVLECKPRSIRCYKRPTLTQGRVCQFLERDGRRWDLIYMGILKSEWEQQFS